MERFDIYKGLLGLRAINLSKKTGRSKLEPINLPDLTGIIATQGSVISSATQANNSTAPSISQVTAKQLFNDQDMLYCDIHSYQVWVELKISLQSPVKRYKVFLFIKLDRSLTIQKFKRIIQKLVIKLWMSACSPEKNKLLYIMKDLKMKIERGGGTISSTQRIMAQNSDQSRKAEREDLAGRKASALGANRPNGDPQVVSQGEHRLFERSEGIIEDYFNFEGAINVNVNFNILMSELVQSQVREDSKSSGFGYKRRLSQMKYPRSGGASPMRAAVPVTRPKKHPTNKIKSKRDSFRRGGSNRIDDAIMRGSSTIEEVNEPLQTEQPRASSKEPYMRKGLEIDLSSGHLSYDGDHEMNNSNSSDTEMQSGRKLIELGQPVRNNNDFRPETSQEEIETNNARTTIRPIPLSPRDFDKDDNQVVIDQTHANLKSGCVILRNRDFSEEALVNHRRMSRFTQRLSQLSPMTSNPSQFSSSNLSGADSSPNASQKIIKVQHQPMSLQPERLSDLHSRMMNQRTNSSNPYKESSSPDDSMNLRTEPAVINQTPGQAIMQAHTLHSFLNPMTRESTQQDTIAEAPQEQEILERTATIAPQLMLDAPRNHRLTYSSVKHLGPLRRQSTLASQKRASMTTNSHRLAALSRGHQRDKSGEKSEFSILGYAVEHGYINDEVAQMEQQLHLNELINRVKVPEFVLTFQEIQEVDIPTIRDMRFEGAELLDKDTEFMAENKSESRREYTLLRRCSKPVWITLTIVGIVIVLALIIVLSLLYA